MSDEKALGFWGELAKWFKETFPTALAFGGFIYTWMRIKLNDEEKAHAKTKLQKELVENELAVERDFSHKSDADTIKSVIGRNTPKS